MNLDFIRPIAGAALAVALSLVAIGQSRAAEILVPAHHTTITSAVAAAVDGDTIRITAAPTPFNEAVTIDKAITLVANPGIEPRLTGFSLDGGTTFTLRTMPGAAGAVIGSEEGGRFILEGTPTRGGSMIHSQHTSGTVLFENIKIQNAPNTSAFRVASDGGAHLKLIEAIGTVTGFNGYTAAAQTAEFLIERSRFVEIGSRSPVYIRATSSNFTFRYCEFHSVSSVLPLVGREAISIYGGTNGTVTFFRCWMRQDPSTGTWMTAEARPRDGSTTASPIINYLYCVIEHAAMSRPVNVRNNMSAGVTMTLDHCDIINHVSTYGCIDMYTGTGRTITVTNSNLINRGGGPGVSETGTGNTVTLSHNNVITTGTAYVGLTPAQTIAPAQEPGYRNAASGDFTYSNATLLTADQDGRPVGSNYNFSDILGPPVSRVRDWTRY